MSTIILRTLKDRRKIFVLVYHRNVIWDVGSHAGILQNVKNSCYIFIAFLPPINTYTI
jgi:hypothetical protein